MQREMQPIGEAEAGKKRGVAPLIRLCRAERPVAG